MSSASSFSFFEIQLKKFSIGLKSGLRGGIENTSALTFDVAFKAAAEFCTGHPSCKSKRPSQCSVSYTHLGKVYVPLMQTTYHPNDLSVRDLEQSPVQVIGLP